MTLFSAELPVLFSFVQVSGYLGTLEKSQKIYIKNQRSGSFPQSKGGHRAARRVPGAAQPLAAPLALLAWSHVPRCPTLALFILPTQKPQNRSRFSNLRRGAAATLCSSSGELIWRLLWPPVRGNHRHRHHHRLSITPPWLLLSCLSNSLL